MKKYILTEEAKRLGQEWGHLNGIPIQKWLKIQPLEIIGTDPIDYLVRGLKDEKHYYIRRGRIREIKTIEERI